MLYARKPSRTPESSIDSGLEKASIGAARIRRVFGLGRMLEQPHQFMLRRLHGNPLRGAHVDMPDVRETVLQS